MENQTVDQKRNDILLIGSGFNIVGNITGHGLCVIDGSVSGTVEASDVKVNTGANINGELKCTRLDVNGFITGIIEAQDVVLREHAQIDGKLTYARMSMEAGAQIDGEVHLLSNTRKQIDNNWIEVHLPEEVASSMAAGQKKTLSLPNGAPPPKWARLLGNTLQIDKNLMDRPENDNEAEPTLMITIDNSSFLIHIPAPV